MNVQRQLANPFIRILLFVAFNILLFFSLTYIDNVFGNGKTDASVLLVLSLLITSAGLELFRGKSHWNLFGFNLDRFFFKDSFLGLLIVLMNTFIIAAILWIVTDFHTNNDLIVNAFFRTAGFFLIFVLLEELIFRGVLFDSICDAFGKTIGILSTSIFFAFLHFLNPGISFFSLFNVLLAGILLGLMKYQTNSLWLPISFHFLWNFSTGMILGSNVSGMESNNSIFKYTSSNLSDFTYFLIGRKFGIEEGIVTTLLLLFNAFLILKISKPSPFVSAKLFKRNHFESSIK